MGKKILLRLTARYRGSYLSYMLLYTFYFGSIAFLSGLVSVYLLGKGYTSTQVSFVISCSLAASMGLQPLIGMLTDRVSNRVVTGFSLLLAGVFGVLFLFAGSLWSVALCYSLALGLVNSANPVVERSATLSKHPYRSIRIWGTLGYAVCSQLGGIAYRYLSPESMYLFFALSVLLCALGLAGTRDEKGPAARGEGSSPGGKGGILSRPFLLYLLVAALFTGITGVSSTYFPAMLQEEGIPVDVVSTVLFVLTLSELPLIFFSQKFMDRLSNTQLLAGVFLLLVAQYGVYSLIPVPALHVAAAVLTKAVATMSFIMINLKVVAAFVPAGRQITALSLAATCRNFGSVAFQMAGGTLLEGGSYPFFYGVLLLFSLGGLALCILSRFPEGNRVRMFS